MVKSMLNKTLAISKAAYIQLRVYMFWIFVALVLDSVSKLIQYWAVGYQPENYGISVGNFLSLILLIAAVILPLPFFRRMMNLGATRQDYYIGVTAIYVVGCAALAALNVILYKLLDQGLLLDYVNYFDLFHIFHWDQFNVVGMFLYQFAVLLLLVSFIHLMFSAVRSHVGISLWVIVAAAIPISTSIAAYRAKLADGLYVLLFNDSLISGSGICFLLSIACLIGGWFFTSRRTY
jgi:hypothetical protein